jgi:hypothetical protein
MLHVSFPPLHVYRRRLASTQDASRLSKSRDTEYCELNL